MLNFILDNVASQSLTFLPTFIWLKNTILNNICILPNDCITKYICFMNFQEL